MDLTIKEVIATITTRRVVASRTNLKTKRHKSFLYEFSESYKPKFIIIYDIGSGKRNLEFEEHQLEEAIKFFSLLNTESNCA